MRKELVAWLRCHSRTIALKDSNIRLCTTGQHTKTIPWTENPGQWRSGQKKQHKLKLLGPDIFRWGGDLPRKGVGSQVRYVPRNPGKINYLAGYSRIFAWISRPKPEQFENIKFKFWPRKNGKSRNLHIWGLKNTFGGVPSWSHLVGFWVRFILTHVTRICS